MAHQGISGTTVILSPQGVPVVLSPQGVLVVLSRLLVLYHPVGLYFPVVLYLPEVLYCPEVLFLPEVLYRPVVLYRLVVLSLPSLLAYHVPLAGPSTPSHLVLLLGLVCLFSHVCLVLLVLRLCQANHATHEVLEGQDFLEGRDYLEDLATLVDRGLLVDLPAHAYLDVRGNPLAHALVSPSGSNQTRSKTQVPQ